MTIGAFGLANRRHVKIPRVGTVRVHENTRRLHQLLVLERARLLNVTVRRGCRRMLTVFTVELMRPQPNVCPIHPYSVVGVDAGVRHLATIATRDGEVVEQVVTKVKPFGNGCSAWSRTTLT